MAYVPDYEYDIFISYAHADDALDEQGVRWVTEFKGHLITAVRRHGADEARAFFDAIDLHTNHPIETVLDCARKSAVFVPVISSSYVARFWTNAEFDAFAAEAQQAERIFPVKLLPPIQGCPPHVEALKGVDFWFTDENEGDALLRLTGKNNAQVYSARLNKLAVEIVRCLRGMSPESKRSKLSPISGKTVLLAEVTADLRNQRESVRNFLEQYGVTVLPKGVYPEESSKFIEVFSADLKTANLFIQLLSDERTERLKADQGEEMSSGRFQFDAALRAGVPLIQWLDPRVKPHLLKTLNHFDKPLIDGSLQGGEIVSSGLEEFKRIVKAKLELLTRPAPQQPRAKKSYIFITAGVEDEARASELRDKFTEADVVAEIFRIEDGSAATRETFINEIKSADAVVFLYGEVDPKFIRRWQSEYVRKGEAGQRLEAVYDAPPENKPNVPVSWRELLHFGSRKAFVLDDVQKILAILRRDAR